MGVERLEKRHHGGELGGGGRSEGETDRWHRGGGAREEHGGEGVRGGGMREGKRWMREEEG